MTRALKIAWSKPRCNWLSYPFNQSDNSKISKANIESSVVVKNLSSFDRDDSVIFDVIIDLKETI